MIRTVLAATALVGLTACGSGNPFDTTTLADGGPAADSAIPATITSSLVSFAYDPAAETLTLRGLLRDEDVTDVAYTRNAALDEGVYRAFTAQDDPLDQHTTVFVREHGSVAGLVAATGGQFTFYSGGVNFTRSGGYDPHPVDDATDTGLVTYTGEYIGLSNLNGPGGDLLPVPAGAGGGSITPAQASVVNGRVFINIGFASGSVAGTINQRVINSGAFGTVALPDLTLVPTQLDASGRFTGGVEIEGTRRSVGDYAGIVGGTDSEVMAGGIFVEEQFDTTGTLGAVTGEEEYGVFVIGKCGGAFEDASPDCSAVDD